MSKILDSDEELVEDIDTEGEDDDELVEKFVLESKVENGEENMGKHRVIDVI